MQGATPFPILMRRATILARDGSKDMRLQDKDASDAYGACTAVEGRSGE